MDGPAGAEVRAANQAFYDAHEARDLDAMRAVWDHGDDAACIHPGWPILRGWPLVEESWRRIFAGPGRNQFILTNDVVTVQGDVAWVTLDENLVDGAATGTSPRPTCSPAATRAGDWCCTTDRRSGGDARHVGGARRGRTFRSMSDKPSYLGLLNAIAVAERQAGEYLDCGPTVTPSDDVRAVIHTVALRETEHGLAFEKRIDELGYGLVDKPDPNHAKRMTIASSTTLSDREKFEALGLGRAPTNGTSDIFDNFFENKDLDPGRPAASSVATSPRSATPAASSRRATPRSALPRPRSRRPRRRRPPDRRSRSGHRSPGRPISGPEEGGARR